MASFFTLRGWKSELWIRGLYIGKMAFVLRLVISRRSGTHMRYSPCGKVDSPNCQTIPAYWMWPPAMGLWLKLQRG